MKFWVVVVSDGVVNVVRLDRGCQRLQCDKSQSLLLAPIFLYQVRERGGRVN